MAFGIMDTSYVDLPPNIDVTYLRGLQTRAGLSVADMISRVDAAMTQVNEGVDPLMSALLAPRTTAEFARGNRTSGMKPQKKSQYTPDRPQLVERTAHMLAIDEYDIATGWTEDGLQEVSEDGFQIQVDAMREGFERAARADTLIRFFSEAEIVVDPVKETTATSPGLAGSGTGGNVFVGVYPDGTALPGGYTHYYRDTTANRAAVVKAARDRLKKWTRGPFDLVGSEVSIAALVALGAPDFVPTGSVLIRPAIGTAEALVDAIRYVGVFAGDIRVWQPITDFADDHYAIFKSFGTLAANNPLVWRYDPLRGPDAYVRSRALFPLAQANAMWKFGVNISNRVGAAMIRIAASGNYTPPTITY